MSDDPKFDRMQAWAYANLVDPQKENEEIIERLLRTYKREHINPEYLAAPYQQNGVKEHEDGTFSHCWIPFMHYDLGIPARFTLQPDGSFKLVHPVIVQFDGEMILGPMEFPTQTQ